jgi:hypothetical protein
LTWELKTPSGQLFYLDYIYQENTIQWDHNIDFNPRIGISSRYATTKINERFYGSIDVAKPVEELQTIDIKIKPIVPVQHIELKITIKNEQT